MSRMIKNEDGTETEVFTQEEIDKRAEEVRADAVKKYQEENPDKSTELTEAKELIDKLNQDLKDAQPDDEDDGDDSGQIKRLKREKREAEDKAKELMDGVVKDLDSIKETRINDLTTTLLNGYAKDDSSLREKIQIEFNDYKPQDTSVEGIRERMAKANQLVTGAQPSPSILDGVISPGSRGEARNESAGDTYNKNEMAIAKALGITKDDIEKYGTKKVS